MVVNGFTLVVCSNFVQDPFFCPCKMASGSKRSDILRSRSPARRRAQRSSGNCPICLNPLTGREEWNCLACNVAFHVDCMPRNTAGRIHLPNGCPSCRTTMTACLRAAQRVEPAPHGAICAVCWRSIRHGTDMHRCAAPRSHCLATWHQSCNASVRERCPACRLTVFNALQMRQHRSLNLV